jgi:hypothetical protein
MMPVMIHADGTECAHPGPPQATVDDDGGPRCPAGIPVTRVRMTDGREMTVEEAVEAFRDLGTAIIEAFRPLEGAVGPFFAALAEAARRHRHRCLCLCGRAHPADTGVCDGEMVTTRHYETDLYGPVDVPLCAPCAAAQFLAEMT